MHHALIPISFLMHESDGLQFSQSLSSSAACVFGSAALGLSRPSIIYKDFFFFLSVPGLEDGEVKKLNLVAKDAEDTVSFYVYFPAKSSSFAAEPMALRRNSFTALKEICFHREGD